MKATMIRQKKIILAMMLTMLFAVCFIAADKATAATGLNMGNADPLKLGEQKTVSVNTSGSNYSKTFKVQTSKRDSFYNLELTNSTIDKTLWAEVYDSSGTMLDELNIAIDTNEKNNDCTKLNKNSTYYILVSQVGKRKTGEYKLRLQEIVDEAADDSYHAKKISFGKSMSGKLQTKDDEEWYKITAVKTGTHKIIIKNPSERSFFAALYNRDVIEKDSFWVEDHDKNSFKVNLKAGQYVYIYFWSRKADVYKPLTYSIEAKNPPVAKPAKVKLASVKAGKRCLAVKYRAARQANSYQIALKKKGGSWKYYNTKDLSKKIRKLAKKKSYTVKVRGIRNYEGKKYYGSWSKAKTVKTK